MIRKKAGSKAPTPALSKGPPTQRDRPWAEFERLVPRAAYEFAQKRRDGTLPDTAWPSGFLASDEKMLPYLDALAEGDETRAIQTLASVLAGWPTRIWHEYTRSQLIHLSQFCQHPDMSPAFRQCASSWLAELVKAWAYGMTSWEVAVNPPRGKRGQTPLLFPLIDELSREGARDHHAAHDFVHLWDVLMTCLHKRIGWKSIRNEFRAGSSSSRDSTVIDAVRRLKPVLQGFRADHDERGADSFAYCWLAGEFPGDDRLGTMVRTALEVPSARNPREEFGYQFFSHFQLVFGGWELMESSQPRYVSPSLLKSTLRTLAKRGVRRRHSRAQSRRSLGPNPFADAP